MKTFFRKLVTLIVCMGLAVSLFAEPASTGITDSDVKNYAKNINSITKELNALGAWTNDSINATAKQKNSVDAVLNKYGISGSNCIEKFSMITSCAVVLVAESELDAQSAALLQSLGMDPMAEIKKNVNSKDYNVVKANSAAVIKAYNNLDTSNLGASEESYDIPSNMNDYYANLANAFAQYADESEQNGYAGNNEDTESIKKLYDQMSKAKGDSGVIYKSKKNGSKYKKTEVPAGLSIALYYGEEGNEIDWTFNLATKKAKLDFTWVGKTQTINYTITKVDYYHINMDSGLGGEGNEYIITTKEGPVFHFFDEWDFSGNAFQKQIGIKGITFESLFDADSINWFYSH